LWANNALISIVASVPTIILVPIVMTVYSNNSLLPLLLHCVLKVALVHITAVFQQWPQFLLQQCVPTLHTRAWKMPQMHKISLWHISEHQYRFISKGLIVKISLPLPLTCTVCVGCCHYMWSAFEFYNDATSIRHDSHFQFFVSIEPKLICLNQALAVEMFRYLLFMDMQMLWYAVVARWCSVCVYAAILCVKPI
jgi:hypothetical protein